MMLSMMYVYVSFCDKYSPGLMLEITSPISNADVDVTKIRPGKILNALETIN